MCVWLLILVGSVGVKVTWGSVPDLDDERRLHASEVDFAAARDAIDHLEFNWPPILEELMEVPVVDYLAHFVECKLDLFPSLLQLLFDVKVLDVFAELQLRGSWGATVAPSVLYDACSNSSYLVFDEHLRSEARFVSGP